ncbi:S41 family peptidase [Sungkyunkwania multivorans]|uniref:S41 family peptidase n=1 Tax=Sungkyunkwania multivorans TaxID=1173618 RepID=A0ABW3CX68_9FLAO
MATIVVIATALGCSDRDDSITQASGELVEEDFIWKGLNLFYFWQDIVPDLADDRFTTNQEYTEFLRSWNSPEEQFYNLCYQHEVIVGSSAAEDRFSFITDDYNELISLSTGEFRTNGVEFGLIRFQDNNDVFGYVRYILPNSDASTKNIQRGDFFLGVNGTQITVDNFSSLLFGSNDSYTLNMASIANASGFTSSGVLSSALELNNVDVALTKAAYTENPVFITKTIETGGKRIGYLMYNGFTSAFNTELNNAFATFQNPAITDLVIDLRYNPGGSVNTATALASMITGGNAGQLFLKERWNSKIQPQLSEDQISNNFASQLSNGTDINSLGLSEVYILTTGSSASASEALINGLDPYITVKQIGTRTRGKNEFSITLVDDVGNSLVYNPGRVGNINPNNSYGMQPLVGRIENAAGFFDYTDGIAPETNLPEDLTDLGILGDETEPLLAEAIAQITGTTRRSIKDVPDVRNIYDSKEGIRFWGGMQVDGKNLPPINDLLAIEE